MRYCYLIKNKVAKTLGCVGTAAVLCCESNSATITGRVVDTSGNPSATNVIFAPLSTPIASAGRIVYSTVKSVDTDTNGYFVIALEAGNYRATIGTNVRDSFVISVPADNSTNDWLTLISGSLTYSFPYSPIYEEKRLKGITNGYAALDENGRVPVYQLGGGTPGSNNFLRADGLWSGILPENIGSGIISGDEFYALDGLRSSVQSQIDRRVKDLNGFATNLFVERAVFSAGYRLISSERPAQLSDGDCWYDNSQRCRMLYQSGLIQALETAIFVSTNSITCTNTTAETSIMPSGVGGVVLPSGFLAPGKSINIKMRGIYSSPSVTATVILKFKIGDSVLTTPAFGYSTAQANKYIYVDYQLTCIASGTNGAYVSAGQFGSQTFTYGFTSATNPQNSTISIDTTRDNAISITATHSRADASLTINQLTIKTIF